MEVDQKVSQHLKQIAQFTEDQKHNAQTTNQIATYFAGLQSSVDPYQIPPNYEALKDYKQATSVGYVKDMKVGREPFSLLFKDNKPFNICDKCEMFSQMGPGYYTIFLYMKYIICLAILPISIYSFLVMLYYMSGQNCLPTDKLQLIQTNATNSTDWSRIKDMFPDSDLWSRIEKKRNTNASEHTELNIYSNLYCFKGANPAKCAALESNGCHGAMNSKCANKTLDLFLENYVTGLCRRETNTISSLPNRIGTETPWYIDLADGLFLFFTFVGISIILYFHEKRALEFDEKNNTIEDYSVKLLGLRPAKSVYDLSTKLTEVFAKHGMQVKCINYCYDTTEYIDLQRKATTIKRDLVKEDFKRGIVHHKRKELNMIKKIHIDSADAKKSETEGLLEQSAPDNPHRAKLQETENKIDEFSRLYSIMGVNNDYFHGSAYVTFATQAQKISALSIFGRGGWLYNIVGVGPIHTKLDLILQDGDKRYQLWVEPAPSPQDIIWENQSYSNFSRFIRSAVSLLITAIIIAIDFFVILYITLWGQNWTSQRIVKTGEGGSSVLGGFLGTGLVSIVIFVFDFGFQYLLYFLGDFEKEKTFTKKETVVTEKLWKIQFVAAAIIPASISLLQLNFYGKSGLIYTLNSIFLSYMILPPVSLLFGNIWLYYKKIQKGRIHKFIKGEKDGKIATQEEANSWWLKDTFYLSFCYSFVIKNFALVLFFVPIYPVCCFYVIASLVIMYWGYKYVLIMRSNKLIYYSTRISKHLIKEIEYCLLLFVLGLMFRELINSLMSLQEVRVRAIHLVYLAMVFVGIMFDTKKFVTDFLPEVAETDLTYDEMILTNPNNYEMANPAKVRRKPQFGETTPIAPVAASINIPVMPKQDLFEIDKAKEVANAQGIAINHAMSIIDTQKEEAVKIEMQKIKTIVPLMQDYEQPGINKQNTSNSNKFQTQKVESIRL
jgi:hypothetical protein